MPPRRGLEQILRHVELDRSSVTDWSAHPFSIPAVAHLDRLELDPHATVLVGENDTEHVAITKAFLMNPARMLTELFRDIDGGARRDR